MRQAILIAGNSRRFLDDLYSLRQFLVEAVGLRQSAVRLISAAYVDLGIIQHRLERAIGRRTKDPLLLVFSGHGNTDGWYLDDDRFLSFEELAKMLTLGKRPVTVIGDCCHAMAAVAHFEKLRVPPERLSYIAASGADMTCRGGLIGLVERNWRRRRPNVDFPTHRRTVVKKEEQETVVPDNAVPRRWGAILDYNFFPSAVVGRIDPFDA